MDVIYPDIAKNQGDDDEEKQKHKEEYYCRRKADEIDRQGIEEELAKHSHPLNVNSDRLYNIVTGQIASEIVNVVNALEIGSKVKYKFISDLPEKFYSSISSPVKTMESLKKGIKIGTSIIYNMETIFLQLLTIGQSRQLQLAPVFEYELCGVPSWRIWISKKGVKSTLVQKLGTTQKEAKTTEILIVDAQQLLLHVVWPVGETFPFLHHQYGNS